MQRKINMDLVFCNFMENFSIDELVAREWDNEWTKMNKCNWKQGGYAESCKGSSSNSADNKK